MSYNLGHVVGGNGKGIESIVKTDTTGLVDTYTITYTNGDTQTFTVTNSGPVVDVVEDGNTSAVSSDAVYDYVTSIIGDIQEYVNR